MPIPIRLAVAAAVLGDRRIAPSADLEPQATVSPPSTGSTSPVM